MPFACFAALAKIASETLHLWAQVLANCPDAQLHLQHVTWHDDRVRDAFTERAGAHSIAAEWLVFSNKLSYQEILAELNALDIMLDMTPFSGSSISAEALWMGVPVVTSPNQRFSSRTSASLLTAIARAHARFQRWKCRNAHT